MCGIAGIVSIDRTLSKYELSSRIERMTTAIRYRGPDHEQFYVDESVGLAFGHRRLAIIDLSPSGNQPKESNCGRFITVYNGEIYNYRELRAELEKKGHQFRGASDTEVMLTGFTEWGIARTLPKLLGMFAIAVWDRKEKRLTLVRDRVGKKPLYYGWVGRELVFASELKAIRALPNYFGEINQSALGSFLHYSYVPSPLTIDQGIHQLNPGSFIEYDFNVSKVYHPESQEYWSMSEAQRVGGSDPFMGSEKEAIDQLDFLLTDATDKRMLSDVPLGAFLSGGIDSSLIVSLMQKLSSKPIRTFTIGYDDPSFNESHHAKAVADHLGTQHTELVATEKDAMGFVESLGQIYDEPFSDASQIPMLLVSKLTRQHVTVALSGDGGDEFFGGYDRYRTTQKLEMVPSLAAPLVSGAAGLMFETLNKITHQEKYLRASRIIKNFDSESVYYHYCANWNVPENLIPGFGSSDAITQWTAGLNPKSRGLLSGIFYWDARRYLTDDGLVKVDRASMRNALEIRAPLLDHRVIEFAWRLPIEMKLGRNHGKHILRELLYRNVPRELVDRPKQGFGLPLAKWLSGGLKSWSEDLMTEECLKKSGQLDVKLARGVWNEFQSGRKNLLNTVWAMLMFQSWYFAREKAS
ncbi:MAG: asparagine synthase (glutamine-hydrolyzing) [Xanthomonadaceae bacterium]|nr:asparagine synthase (glutamine-hydrolyzing) [Xanthomonadaceae bacterium]